MKLDSYQFQSIMCVLHAFRDFHPEFNDRASVETGSPDAEISNAICVLNETFCEPNRITPQQMNAAIEVLRNVPATATAQQVDEIRAIRAAAAKSKYNSEHPNRDARKAAARSARYETDTTFRARCDSYGTRPERRPT